MTAAILLLLIVPTEPKATAEPTYYMVVFAGHRPLNPPKFAHSFATFIKETPGEETPLEVVTISWIGTKSNWRLFSPEQPGRNMSLEESLQRCVQRGQLISMWGPYQIEPELYHRACAQKAKLDSGCIQWQAVDRRTRQAGIACNCFHAISDMWTEQGMMHNGLARGKTASRQVVQHLGRFILCPPHTHDHLIPLLELDKYCIHREPTPPLH